MTFGTWLKTWFQGEHVGVDEFGNNYYRSKKRKLNKREERWVVYKGMPEASKVPAEWHAWLHHTVDNPLTEEAAKAHIWQQDHLPNLTGTARRYSEALDFKKNRNTYLDVKDYEPWQPDK